MLIDFSINNSDVVMEQNDFPDQLLVLSRSGSGHVLRFDCSLGVLSKRPQLEIWAKLQNLKEFSCVSYSHYVYVIGGFNTRLKRCVDYVKRYDIVRKEWTDLPHMHSERRLCSCIVFNDEILVCGGFTNSGKLIGTTEIFNISRNKWRRGAALKFPRADMQLTIVDNSVLAFGGMKHVVWKGEKILCGCDDIWELADLSSIWMLTDEHIPLILGKPVCHHSVISVNSRVYILGGLKTIIYNDGRISESINKRFESILYGDSRIPYSNNEIRDWISPWNHMLPTPTLPRFGAAIVNFGNDIYLFGGTAESHPDGVFLVEKFNTRRCLWTNDFEMPREADLSFVSSIKVSRSQTVASPLVKEIDLSQTENIKEEDSKKQDRKVPMYRVSWVLW